MIMKKITLLLMFMVFSVSSFSMEEVNIRVADYPPNYYQDASGNWTGIDVDLAAAIVKEAGYKPVFLKRPWTRALSDMKVGKLDLMMNLSKTDERAQFMRWIGPERSSQMSLIVKEENSNLKIKNVDDLISIAKEKNMKIGIQQDVFYSKEFNERLDNDASFKRNFSPIAVVELNARKTQKSRIIGFFEEKLSMVHNIKHNKDYAGLAVHDFIVTEENVFFGVSIKADKTKNIYKNLNKAYDKLKVNGTLDKIIAKYSK